MRTQSTIDLLLSLKMGTTGVLTNLHETVKIDYIVDKLDDKRRENYITVINDAIEKLEHFSEFFNNKEFKKWSIKFIKILKEDLKEQLYYEKLSDDLRDKLHLCIRENKERLRNENNELELEFVKKNYNLLD